MVFRPVHMSNSAWLIGYRSLMFKYLVDDDYVESNMFWSVCDVFYLKVLQTASLTKSMFRQFNVRYETENRWGKATIEIQRWLDQLAILACLQHQLLLQLRTLSKYLSAILNCMILQTQYLWTMFPRQKHILEICKAIQRQCFTCKPSMFWFAPTVFIYQRRCVATVDKLWNLPYRSPKAISWSYLQLKTRTDRNTDIFVKFKKPVHIIKTCF